MPTGSEVKVYKRDSWACLYTLSDLNYHKEVGVVVGVVMCGRWVGGGNAWLFTVSNRHRHLATTGVFYWNSLHGFRIPPEILNYK